ncbi:DUF1800 family protein [Verrucomicrobium spinosum]|uniref:DUF1800 family protein n=1 Tax=Verrucomicrobium spinosum TaxID=2736 RepID=UPI002108EAF7|nr:DUF1800 family protein [Verrucomicrobium spinosum]
MQRFTTSNPSSGYLYRVSNVYKNTCGDLGEVIKAILLDYEARSLSIADGTVASGKVKEPLLHFTSMLRSLKCYTGLPLVNLTTVPIAFTSLESPVTTAYPVSEYNKFPAGACASGSSTRSRPSPSLRSAPPACSTGSFRTT